MRLVRPVLLLLTHHLISTTAFLTHASVRNITSLTDDLRMRISSVESSSASFPHGSLKARDGQAVLEVVSGGDESEIVVAAAMKLLCADILVELEKPMARDGGEKKLSCNEVIDEYHAFLAATAKFLKAVNEEETKWRWNSESIVFDAVTWLQALWASRSANKQHRSFIEQQMILYEYHQKDGCFGKDDEVLRRGVEIVEFLNDLLDTFN